MGVSLLDIENTVTQGTTNLWNWMFTTRDAIIRQLTSEADPFKNEKKRKDLSETMSVMSKRRAYTGIEPVTSRTLSENHTTRPAGLM